MLHSRNAGSHRSLHCANGKLHHDGEDTSDYAEERNTLNQSSSKDHVGTDLSAHFRLTGDGFQRSFTDLTHTDTGSQSGDTGTNCTAGRGDTFQ